jgi:hypothetical protein
MNLVHLARRFVTSLSRRPPGPADEAWAEGWLLPGEVDLWRRRAAQDRRHAIVVARRFVTRRRHADRAEVSGALLHDVGKVDAGLGTLGRVVATLVGPRTDRFRAYHDHEAIGARMAAAAGADPVTVSLIEGHGPAASDLARADEL